MLTSFATATSSSPSSPYESPPSWWKLNFTTGSYATFTAAFLPSSQESSTSNVVEKRTTNIDHQCNPLHTNGFNDEPLRILLFAESFPSFTSGITRRFKEIIRRLAKRKHYIHVITGCKNARAWVEGNENLEEYVTFSILPSTEFTNKIDCACPFLFPHPTIYSAVRRFSPDVAHIVEQTPAAMLCGAFVKSLNVPIVWSSHTNIDFYLSTYIRPYAVAMTRRVYQFIRLKHLIYSSMNLTVSQDFADFMENTGVPRPVIVWKTGVDSELFNPSRRSRSMRYRMFGTYNNYTEAQMDSITLFLCVGRISPEKNFEFLSLVLERIPTQTFLCIIGDGPYRHALEPIFPKDRVYFFGYLGGEELASAYASADYFIYASVSETFGQVYLEAMASGTPVIAAEGGQLKEFFLIGEHGYLWEPDNLDSAEDAIRSAMQKREYLSIKARQQALKHSWDSAGDQLNNIYYDAVKRHKHQTKNQTMNFMMYLCRLFYYGLNWALCMLLAVLLMAPFVQVSSPKAKTTQMNDRNNNNNYQSKPNSILTTKKSS
jgi:glycosyltransferase involved in cell wall biosynthesis